MPPFAQAMAEGDFETGLVFAGEVVDLIDAVVPAADLVQRIGAEAEARLRDGPAIARLAPGVVPVRPIQLMLPVESGAVAAPCSGLAHQPAEHQHVDAMHRQAVAALQERPRLLARQRQRRRAGCRPRGSPVPGAPPPRASRARRSGPETPSSVERSNAPMAMQSMPSTRQIASMFSTAARVSIVSMQTVSSPALRQVVERARLPSARAR